MYKFRCSRSYIFCIEHLHCVRKLHILSYWVKLISLYARDLLDSVRRVAHRLFVTQLSFALCGVHVKVCSSTEQLTRESF